MIAASGIDDALSLCNTTMDLLLRMSKGRCGCDDNPPADVEAVQNAVRKLLQELQRLRAGAADDPKKTLLQAVRAVNAVKLPAPGADCLGRLMPRIPVHALLWTASGMPTYFASGAEVPGNPELGPGDVSKGLDALIEYLRRLIEESGDSGSSYEIRKELEALIEEIEEFEEKVREELVGIDVEDFVKLIGEYLERAFQILRQYGYAVGPVAAAVRNGIAQFISRLIGLLGGGEAGFATTGMALRLGLYSLAFYIGHLIGKWIGKQVVDGKTINDWLADALYYEYFAVADECLDLEAAYYAAARARRDYENSGPTLDKSVMLALLGREYSLLFELRETAVRKHCYDDVSGFDKELDRLKERYRRLSR